MMVSADQLRRMMPGAGSRLAPHVPYLGPAMLAAGIDTPRRVAAFVAQVAHESGDFQFMEELTDGSAYEGRVDLGNTRPGDGVRFKGHGPIQITGRANHAACGRALGIDLEANPRLITTPPYASASACWFWNSRRLSPLADRDWFLTITKRINGGYTHLADRLRRWERCRDVLGLPAVDVGGEELSIKEFQRARGLAVDGDAGPRTVDALIKEEGK